MALVTKRKQLQFKVETTPGTAETTGFTALNVYDFQPPNTDLTFADIEGQSGFNPLNGLVTVRKGTVSFKVDLTYKSAADPAWMGLLLGCAHKLDTGVYSPTSIPPGVSGGSKCLTFVFNHDGRQQVVYGSCGSFVLNASAGGKITATFTFDGLLATPTDASLASLTLPSGETVAKFASVDPFTIGGTTLALAELELDMGVERQVIEDCTAAHGYKHFVPTNMRATGSITMLSNLNSGFRPLLRALAGTTGALAWRIGGAGAGVAIAAPVLQFTGESPADRNGVSYDQGSFVLLRSGASGDDCITWDGTAT